MKENTTLQYDLKRVDKLNLTVIWVLLSLMIMQAFLKSGAWGMRVAVECGIVGVLATVNYFVKLNRFVKSLLFGLIPAVAICAAMYLGGFTLVGHYIIFCSTAVIALYFNRRLVITYGVIMNAVLISVYLLSPGNLTGEPTGIPHFLAIIFMFNGQIVVLSLLTKWAGGLLSKAIAGAKQQSELNDRLAEANEIHSKQAEYQKIHVSRLLGVLEMIAGGDFTGLIEVDPADEDTLPYRHAYDAINQSLADSTGAIRRMAGDVSMLAAAAGEGHLSVRAYATSYQGEYRRIVEGMNEALDAIRRPIGDVSAVMARIVEGELDVSSSGQYSGEYAVLIGNASRMVKGLREIIGELTTALGEIAGGNLAVSLHAKYKGEFSAIRESLETSMDAFNEVLDHMRTAANQVAVGTAQVSGGAQSLSQGATEQAAAIEQLMASVDQISSQTRQNALNAGRASALAAEAKEHALAGNGSMQDMLKAMSEINDASENISKIIKVIDEIAFQTNLLALNAAVEAARAGQYGKGFAVVAEEVRSLAARSAGAAKETAALIEGTAEKTGAGMRIAQETADALSHIVRGVEATTELVSCIAAASNEQASAVAQVSRGIGQVAQVVQSTSATAEESAATSQQLSGQAEYLRQMVGRFRLRGGQAAGQALLRR